MEYKTYFITSSGSFCSDTAESKKEARDVIRRAADETFRGGSARWSISDKDGNVLEEGMVLVSKDGKVSYRRI